MRVNPVRQANTKPTFLDKETKGIKLRSATTYQQRTYYGGLVCLNLSI